ncbi:protein of unknown function [Desulfosporosinus hippei DSM 8344]|uniref:DUF4829 domain-containing protein n=2 Tax=Desulfosporosinus TaxID=79206 RepID=A0A1G8FQW1_9FIRM|nr:protein of unknown function [Desulfosporosinus hippei DSM 8344]
MHKSKKIIYLFLALALIGLSIFLVVQQLDKTQVNDSGIIQYSKKDLRDSENVIRDKFFYENEHNLEKVRELYSSKYADSDFRLFNLASIKLLEIKLLEDERNYSYRAGFKDLERKNLIVYKVRYSVEFKDQTIEAIDSGEYDFAYYLIRENNGGNWKIDGTGMDYFE